MLHKYTRRTCWRNCETRPVRNRCIACSSLWERNRTSCCCCIYIQELVFCSRVFNSRKSPFSSSICSTCCSTTESSRVLRNYVFIGRIVAEYVYSRSWELYRIWEARESRVCKDFHPNFRYACWECRWIGNSVARVFESSITRKASRESISREIYFSNQVTTWDCILKKVESSKSLSKCSGSSHEVYHASIQKPILIRTYTNSLIVLRGFEVSSWFVVVLDITARF